MLKTPRERAAINAYSSFMTVEKTLEDVVSLLMQSPRLKRLLYYTDRQALQLPALNQEQTYSLLNNQIKIVPKLQIEPDAKPYVIITLDKFVPIAGQTTFRSVSLSFDILCQYEHWPLDNFKLRPYSIAGEIDALVNRSTITGGNTATFIGAQQLILNEHQGGVSLLYSLETYRDDSKFHHEVN